MIKQYLHLIRYHNILIAQLGIVCSFYILKIDFYDIRLLLLFIIISFFMAAGNIFNDIIDIKADAIDHPNRPLPSKMITISNAYYLLVISILIGCITSLFINNLSLIFLYFVIIPLLFLYPLYFKKIPLLGNIVVAFLISSVFIFSECVILKSYTLLIIPSLLIFGLSLIREIIKDIHDYEGDKKYGVSTLCVVLGRTNTILITSILIIMFMTFLLWPYFSGYYNNNYLLSLIILIEIPMVIVVFLLNKNPNKKTFMNLVVITKYMSFLGLIVLLLSVEKGL